ncbi:hypothetical protein L6164_024053 [Bauhinia variegata]|uniref:Uncharacterized protein n=1 Tax=Bauhinia variegata TaxID=167791 RepID=A0ACB9LX76_BAUVA|nr:hypothetical protein L6164_024053 [Bauhinia variegata]
MEKRVKTEDGFASSGEVEGNLENMSISELITGLRTAFVMEDFDLVEKALTKKETNLKSENEALLRQLELEKLEILRLESELKYYKEQCEEYKVCSEKVKKAQEMHEKLLEKVKQNGSQEKNTIAELRREICKLKEEKRRAELILESEKCRHESIVEDEKSRHELELATWKSKVGELDEKVSKLEKDAKLLMEKRNVQGASGQVRVPTVSTISEQDPVTGRQHTGRASVAFAFTSLREISLLS